MLIAYLRSSSYGQYDMCQFSYFMQYVLGWKTPSGKAADIGSISHKALEFLAKKKMAIDARNRSFYDEETKKEYKIETKIEDFIEAAWDHYTTGPAKHHLWKAIDKKAVYNHVHTAVSYKDGMYNPLKMNVINCEEFFDLVIDQPWAKFEYEGPDGKPVKGTLAIKGTMDLLTRKSEKVMEYVDWKTGRRYDWAKDTVKEHDDLVKDFQVRLYHYALAQKFPDFSMYMMTFFYTKDGGPFHMIFEKDFEFIFGQLKKRFEEIKKNSSPKLTKDWKCSKLCHFGKTLNKDSDFYKGNDNGKTICETMHEEVQQLGLDKITKKYKGFENAFTYLGGGGLSDRTG